MPLTQEQINKLRSKYKIDPLTSMEEGDTKSNGGFFSDIKQDFGERIQAGKDSLSMDQSVPSKILQTAGHAAGFVGDVGFNALKAITPDDVEDVVEGSVQKVAETEPVKNAIGSIVSWATAHPEAARNLQAIVDIGSLIPAGKGAALGSKALESGSKRSINMANDFAETAIGAAKNLSDSRVVGKVSDVITPLDKGTETVLNPSRLIPKERLKELPLERIVAQAEDKSLKLENYVKTAKDAIQDYSKPTPLVKAGEKAEESLVVLNNKLSKQGQLKQEALGVVGDRKVVGLPTYRANLRDELRERVGVNLITTDNGLDVVSAKGRMSKIAFDPADTKLIKDSYEVLRSLGDKPTVRQIDDTVDALQDLLYKRKNLVAIPVNGQVEGVLKSMTGKLNNAVKKVGGEQYRKANAKYEYFVGIRNKLNKALGEEGVKGATLMKQLFSPSGEAPRRLFAKIKELTGIDLVEEATLAKFAMENIGDARQASLLEEVIRGNATSPSSFIGKATERILNKLQDPVGKARRIIDDSKKK
jgi:hypothetical protein